MGDVQVMMPEGEGRSGQVKPAQTPLIPILNLTIAP